MRSGFLNACPPSEVSTSSSSVTSEKGIRNKRKFRTDHVQASSLTTQTPDCSHADGDCESCSSWTLSSSCSLNSEEVSTCTPDGASCFSIGPCSVHQSAMKTSLEIVNMPPPATAGIMASGFCHGCCREDTDYAELQGPDWDNNSESQLEDILINMLDALYKDAVANIVSTGYNQKDALNAVLKNGRWNGKDALTSVVDSSLTWLQSGEARQGVLDFTDLKDMEKHVLAEMVCLLRKVRPFLSKGDAMWCLLVCDMNLLLACALEDDVVPPTVKESLVHTSPSLNLTTTSRSSMQNAANSAVPLPQQTPHLSQGVVHLTSGTMCKQPITGVGNLSSDNRSAFSTPSFSSSPVGKVAVANRQTNTTKLSTTSKSGHPLPVRPCTSRGSVQESKVQASSTPSLPKVVAAKLEVSKQRRPGLQSCECANGDDTCSSGPCLSIDYLKANMNSVDMCAILTKEKHVLKILRNHCLAQTFHPPPETISRKQETIFKPNAGPVRVRCGDGCVSDVEGRNADLQLGRAKSMIHGHLNDSQLGCINKGDRLSVHETKLCLATTPETSSKVLYSSEVVSCKETTISSSSFQPGLTDLTIGDSGAYGEQRKTEILLQLTDRIKYLESQLQEWSDWAQQKVMQAAQRLRKDSSELKALRLERDEYARLKKEKQALEESTMKKLSEMENALRKALSQVDRANTAARRLKLENAEVRAEMEAAKLMAAEYVSACEEVAKKENKSVKKAQVWEKQKTKLQDELTEEKRKFVSVLQQLSQAKEQHQQAEVRWRQEKKGKEEALALVDFERKAKEQVELAFKRQEEALQRKAEAKSQRHREELQRLESEISQFKASLGLQPALTWLHSQADFPQRCSAESYKQMNVRLSAEIASLQNSQREIQRDRECIMCMNEEMSIVFLPCAHQVICIKCNELHLKRGLKDCPSCRTPIQQRIRVYGVNST